MTASPLPMDLMVPKGGFEPPRGLPTTPSRWRVYQFHHFGSRSAIKNSAAVMQCSSSKSSTIVLPHTATLAYFFGSGTGA
jgi:hypothetical protein